MQRVVIDTNVIISGILSRKGAPAELLNTWRDQRFLVIVSPAIVNEVRAVLQYPHIRKKYSLTEEEIEQVILLLDHDALQVPGNAEIAGIIPGDPKDEMFLACALDGQVDAIVSGDHHLLDLGTYQGIPIMTARQFLEKLNSE